jgi:hypothetical protein
VTNPRIILDKSYALAEDTRNLIGRGDPLLVHLTYEPAEVAMDALPWPEGLIPTPLPLDPKANGPLPHADALVVTWTAAEWMALADVLTPGHDKTQWAKYTEHWNEYEDELTWRSPAKEAGCIGNYALTQVGTITVLCFHSQLHLATDAISAPVIEMWKQIIGEVEPSLVITTGTAGGIGESTVLGDVFVVSSAKFNCSRMFKDELWAQDRFASVPYVRNPFIDLAQSTLLPVNAPKLRPVATRDPVIVVGGDVETVDFFGFDDTDDSYHIVSNDPLARTEEMDDATLWLALNEMGAAIPALSVRNASDPMVPSSIGTLREQSAYASKIYEKYGYVTSVGSSIATWAVIANMKEPS